MTSEFSGRHSCHSPDWYTPSPYVEAARQVMGAIDFDPASDAEANLTVKAARYLTEEDDGLEHLWTGKTFINPPGGKAAEFWEHLIALFLSGHVSEAVWIGYSLEQLQSFQNACSITPLSYPMCVPKQRIAFIENAAKK